MADVKILSKRNDFVEFAICAAMLMIDPSKVKNEGDRWEKLVRWQM